MKKIRQIISILSVMAVVVSATVGISRVSADETNIVSYTLDTTTEVNNTWLETNAERNLLKDCYVREVRNDALTDTSNLSEKNRMQSINDNNIDSISKKNTGANPAYFFNPKITMKVNKVLVSFQEVPNAKNFDVYFSQTEAVACQKGQTGAVFDRNQNHISVTVQEGKKDYLLDLESEQICKYIIVEIIRGHSNNFNCYIAEIAAYGEEYKLDDFDQSFLTTNARKNIASEIQSVQEYRNGNGTGTHANMTDNDLSTSRGMQYNSIAPTVDYDFSFAYGRPVTQLILAYADGSAILDFDVYLSNIYAYTNATSEKYVNNIKSVTAVEGKKNYLITLDEPVMASRVVFRLKNPGGAKFSYNIAELGVYAADDVNYTSTAATKDGDYFNKSYFNILSKATVEATDKNPANLTDKNFDNACGLTAEDGNYLLTAEYELPEVLTVNKFMVASVWGGIPQGVEIYASETKEDLYNTAPITYTHNRTSASSFKDASNALEITLNSPVKAKYIGFKFTDAETTLHVSEIGAYSYADTNRDADFNICDLVYINKNLGTANVYADYNKDSTVDASDINALRSELLNK